MPELMTEQEHELLDKLSECSRLFGKVVGNVSKVRQADLDEMVHHIHALQNMVLAQAAARAYPLKYRLMGESNKLPTNKEILNSIVNKMYEGDGEGWQELGDFAGKTIEEGTLEDLDWLKLTLDAITDFYSDKKQIGSAMVAEVLSMKVSKRMKELADG